MYLLGIEIGGTKLQLGVGTADGVLASLWRGTVVPADGPEGIRRQILRPCRSFCQPAGSRPNCAAWASVSAARWTTPRAASSNRTRSRAGTISRWPTGSATWSVCRPSGNDADVAGLAGDPARGRQGAVAGLLHHRRFRHRRRSDHQRRDLSRLRPGRGQIGHLEPRPNTSGSALLKSLLLAGELRVRSNSGVDIQITLGLVPRHSFALQVRGQSLLD